ncbi:MAG: hypothetical protein ACFE9N_13000, partial [Promethearchaeota archaeon]
YKANFMDYFYIYDTEICIMLVSIVILSITIVDPKKYYKSLIPSFSITFFTLILTRLCINLEDKLYFHFEVNITHLFFYEIIIILLIFSFTLFEKIPSTTEIQILDYKKKRKSKMFHLIRVFNGITIILLIYIAINWIYYNFEGGYPIMFLSEGILIVLIFFYPITLIIVLFSLIKGYKDDKQDLILKNLTLITKIRKKNTIRTFYSFIFVIFLLITIFTYLILRYFYIIPLDMKVLIINRYVIPEIVIFVPEVFIIFILLNLIPLFFFIGLHKLISVRFNKRTERNTSYKE